jgi:hypothetical protein
MANYIEEVTNLDPIRFVPSSSRYRPSNLIYYTENKIITFKTYKKQVSSGPGLDDKYYVITPGTEYRPDLVSYAAYGTVDFWWRIMEANNIKDVFDFKSGLNIYLPNTLLR